MEGIIEKQLQALLFVPIGGSHSVFGEACYFEHAGTLVIIQLGGSLVCLSVSYLLTDYSYCLITM